MRRYVEPDESIEERPPDAVLLTYGLKAICEERRTFEGNFEEALRLVRARQFYSMTQLAKHFGKTSAWSTRLKECALRQGLFTLDEFTMCFQRRRDGKGRPPCDLNGLSMKERTTAEQGEQSNEDEHHDGPQGSREASGSGDEG